MITSILFNAVVIVVAVIGKFLIMLVTALNRLFHNMRSFLLESFSAVTFLLGNCLVSYLPGWFQWPTKNELIFGEKLLLARVLYFDSIPHLCAMSHERY